MAEKMNLVMTHNGLQIETAIPDEEMPETITFQGIEYKRETTVTYIIGKRRGIHDDYDYCVCSKCGHGQVFKPMNFCTKCGARVVNYERENW